MRPKRKLLCIFLFLIAIVISLLALNKRRNVYETKKVSEFKMGHPEPPKTQSHEVAKEVTTDIPMVQTTELYENLRCVDEFLDPPWCARLKAGRKIILLYTTWFYQPQWLDFTGPAMYERMDACDSAKKCLLTYDKSYLKQAAGLVFHGRDVEVYRNEKYSASVLKELRKEVPQTQKWIFLSHENPQKDVNIYKPFDGIFNWSSSFSRKSDVFAPFQQFAKREVPLNDVRNYAKEKTGFVAWAVSNCDAKLRLEYALQLEKYINITVYGKCNHKFKIRRNCKHFDKACIKEMSKYKFYLAFENDFCFDYVTEKYWEKIQLDVVPVVLGSNYDGVAIPGSYIDVASFDSIRQLSEYLLYLDKNDDAYNKYFAYKSKYALREGGNLYCKICDKLYSEDAKQHSQIILSEEFNYWKNCVANRENEVKAWKQVKESKG